MKHLLYSISFALIACLFTQCEPEDPMSPIAVVTEVGDAKAFSPSDDKDALDNKDVVYVTQGNTSFYIGYQQVSSNNQNPILVKFVNGVQEWARTDYETTGDDQKGYGLIWDGQQNLYAVFSATGTQGQSSEDFRRFAQDGWLRSYGSGGGAKVAIIAKIDPENGDISKATFLYSKLSSGNSNSMAVKTLSFEDDGQIKVNANAWFSPLNVDKQPFSCSGSSPFDYTIVFSNDLSTAISAEAAGCQ